MDWRERNRLAKRAHILEAARELIRRDGISAFSMRALADRAGVSLTTPYNHFGSKHGVLGALLDELIDRVADDRDDAIPEDPIDQVLLVAERTTELFCEDPDFYRPIVKLVTAAEEFAFRPQVVGRSLDLWSRSLTRAIERGVLVPGSELELLARQLFIQALGVTELWVNGEFDGAEFALQLRYSTLVCLLAFASDASRADLAARLRDTGARLVRGLNFETPTPERECRARA